MPTRPTLALAALSLLAAAPRAGDPPVQLYSLDDKGHVSVGGTRLETLPGGFDPNDFDMPNGTDRWTALTVDGSDRYLLRIDGYLERNGAPLHELPFEVETVTPIWRELDVLDGTVAALRTDGLLSVDGVTIIDREDANDLVFTDLLLVDMAGTPTPFCLRNDGLVWRGNEIEPLFELQEPDSTFGFSEGNSSDTQWQALAFQPSTGLVLALRADGRVRSLDPAGPPPPPPPGTEDELPPEAGEPVIELPFVKKKNKTRFGQRHLYFDLGCTDSGLLRGVRNDGRIYDTEDIDAPIVDLPGKGNRSSQRYVDMLVIGEEHFVLRRDGAIFSGTSDKPLLRTDARAVGLGGSVEVPDLGAAPAHAPRLGRVRARVVEGEAVTLPVIVADVDTPADALGVTVDIAALPGATFDAAALTVSWPAAGAPGTYSWTVTADDGDTAVQRTQKVTVLAAHPDAPNQAPLRANYQPVPALVGAELELPVVVADRDGDELTVELLPGELADAGAVFDAEAGVLRWTPGLGDVGKSSARLTVGDGESERKLKLRFDVQAPLIDVGADS